MGVPAGLEEICSVYGDPRPLLNANGTVDPEVEIEWRRYILAEGVLPWSIPLRMGDPSAGVKRRFWAHKLVVPRIVKVLDLIDQAGLREEIQSWGGVYNFRLKRGAKQALSLHTWGAAIDLNPETNGLGTVGDMHPEVVAIFRSEGWVWGGDFKRRDPMHFQLARG